MSSTTRPRRRLALPDEAPGGWRAFAFGVLWLVLAAAATFGAVSVAVYVLSPVPRVVGTLLLVALSVLALMLTSDSAARWLAGRYSGWGGRVY
jgi:hypothetical protein